MLGVVLRRIYPSVLIGLALLLLGGGIWLVALGSPYYLIADASLLWSAWLVVGVLMLTPWFVRTL